MRLVARKQIQEKLIREVYLVKMKTKFNPIELRYSMQGWMGDFSSVEAVQRADDAELEAIAGSYEAIADRMKQCIDFAKQRDNPYV